VASRVKLPPRTRVGTPVNAATRAPVASRVKLPPPIRMTDGDLLPVGVDCPDGSPGNEKAERCCSKLCRPSAESSALANTRRQPDILDELDEGER
jgi:hypothetical protein